MRCILHIGTEKTGTTSIQAFLDLNRSHLRSCGILVPRSVGGPNNIGLAVAAYNPFHLDDYVKSIGLQTPQRLLNHQSRLIDALRREIEQSKSDGVDTVCFSSEHLHSRLRAEEEVARLREILLILGFKEILVIIYLREQAALVRSLYATAVLYGGRTTAIPEPRGEEYWDNLCDHRRSLLRFRKVFGVESVRPRLFVPEDFVGNSLIADFLSTASIDLPSDELLFSGRENESISAYGLEVLRRLNDKQPMYLEGGALNPIREGIPRLFQLAFKGGGKFQLPLEAVNRYQVAYEASNEWVRQQYFLDRERLFPPASLNDRSAIHVGNYEIEEVTELLNLMLLAKADEKHLLTSGQLINLLLRKFNRKTISAARAVVSLLLRLAYHGKRWIVVNFLMRQSISPEKD